MIRPPRCRSYRKWVYRCTTVGRSGCMQAKAAKQRKQVKQIVVAGCSWLLRGCFGPIGAQVLVEPVHAVDHHAPPAILVVWPHLACRPEKENDDARCAMLQDGHRRVEVKLKRDAGRDDSSAMRVGCLI